MARVWNAPAHSPEGGALFARPADHATIAPDHATIAPDMDTERRRLIQALHDAPQRAMIVAAGAGAQALADLLGVAGASRTLLEALIPYSQASFDQFAGNQPAKYVAAPTARLLAGRAYTRARQLAQTPTDLVGLACTATIATDRPKRGQHRAFVATWQATHQSDYRLVLHKGARDRAGEEDLVGRVMLNALAHSFGQDAFLALPLVEGDHFEESTSDFAGGVQRLIRRELSYFGIHADGIMQTADARLKLILSGSFNPLHDGHLGMAAVAARLQDQPVAFELSVVNVDKPPLPLSVVLERMAQLAGSHAIFATNAPTFVEKARLFPGVTFIVGYDTAERILQPRYYDGSREKLQVALGQMRDSGCRFLVFGRADEDGIFRQLADLHVPEPFARMFQAVPEAEFRADISSTALRMLGNHTPSQGK